MVNILKLFKSVKLPANILSVSTVAIQLFSFAGWETIASFVGCEKLYWVPGYKTITDRKIVNILCYSNITVTIFKFRRAVLSVA